MHSRVGEYQAASLAGCHGHQSHTFGKRGQRSGIYAFAEHGRGCGSSGVATRRTKTWTHAVKTGQHLYLGQVGKKPVEGVREGDRIRIAVGRGAIYVLTPGAKEHRLERIKTE